MTSKDPAGEDSIVGSSYRRFQPPNTVVGEYLEARLVGLELWQSLLFWERAFKESLVVESRKRTRTLSLHDHEENEPITISAQDSMSPEEQDIQDSLFDLTTKMAYQMIRLGVRVDTAKALVSRVVSEHGLKEEHEETLNTLITNVARARTVIG